MSKKLTPEERERIVEMVLDRVPYRAIADELDVSTTTVQRVWHAVRDAKDRDSAEALESKRRHTLLNLRRLADVAFRGYRDAMDRADLDESGGAAWGSVAKGFLAEARAAEREYARLSGMDHPSRLELSGPDKGPLVLGPAPVDVLLERLSEMTPPTVEDDTSGD